MSGAVRIAVAGGGYGSKVALPVYAQLDEFEPVAVWSRSPERARELAAAGGLELGTSDLDKLLSVPGLEAIHVATPVSLHAEFAIAAAERGIHVMCEKPVAMSLEEGRRIAAAVDAAGVVAAVNFGRRMQETRRRLRERTREVLGELRMASISLVHTDHAEAGSRPFTWVNDARLGGGRLQGYGVHDLDLILDLFPDVEAVTAATAVGVPQRPGDDGELHTVTADDAYTILIRFTGGGLGVVSLTSTARHSRGDLVELYGDAGTVRLDAERRLWSGRAGEELRSEGPLEANSSNAFKAVARAFWASIREGAPPEPSLDHGLRVQAVLDAVHTADIERRWVRPAGV
ncbi:MAG TPA: Gfo/Idh/MocA family oxidoreductase [Solirubrobacteraceae bacterium]|jgi:predicted dehydrogenase|nr:Gfo/Idh/MocA family oxidoreductase [Solirubrobacteraceae bacterium]